MPFTSAGNRRHLEIVDKHEDGYAAVICARESETCDVCVLIELGLELLHRRFGSLDVGAGSLGDASEESMSRRYLGRRGRSESLAADIAGIQMPRKGSSRYHVRPQQARGIWPNQAPQANRGSVLSGLRSQSAAPATVDREGLSRSWRRGTCRCHEQSSS
jgi:hypothetical protein